MHLARIAPRPRILICLFQTNQLTKTDTHTSYIYRKKIPKFRDALPRTTAGGFEVDHARFYFACIVSALEYVHSLGVAYRVSSSQCDERTMFGRAP